MLRSQVRELAASKIPTGKTWILTGAAVLALTLSGAAFGQNASSNSIPDSKPPAGQAHPVAQAAEADTSGQSNQSSSLGDLARLVRAKRQTAPKPVKVVDDDNLERGGAGISVVGAADNDSGVDSTVPGRAASRRGKMVLLDFWATWCGPCRESVPDLKQLQAQYGSDQLQVISISADKNEAAWRTFVSQNQMTWEQRIDPSGDMRRQYGVNAFPTFILTDANGNEIHRFVGEDPSVPIANRIAPYMGSAPRGGS